MRRRDSNSLFTPIDEETIDASLPVENGIPILGQRIKDEYIDQRKESGVHSISDLVDEFIWIERRPFRFVDIIRQVDGPPLIHDRSYLRHIYDLDKKNPIGSRNKILHTARQVEKSTTAASMGIALGVAIPNLKGLYVQPRFSQVTVFSQQRFKKIVEESPEIRRGMTSTRNLWQVSGKALNNGTIYNFRSCYLSADAVRGISADFVNIDELQDIPSKEIGVIEECQSHALPDRKIRLYSGTPKTRMNQLTQRYEHSCMFEWLVKCKHMGCHHWNYLDEKVIGSKYFVCTKCGKELYPKRHKNPEDDDDYGGQWIAMKPSLLNVWQGYRISQIQVPFQSFDDISGKLHDPEISFSVFCNEALGLASEEGELVLTENDVLRTCENRPLTAPENLSQLIGGSPIFMGIDHGTGGYGQVDLPGERKRRMPSYTVVVLGAWCSDEKFRIFYMEKFLGERANLARQPEFFDEVARRYSAFWVGSDWGFGHINNDRLRDDFGWVDRSFSEGGNPLLLEMQSVQQRPMVKFDNKAGKVGRYMIDRSSCMRLVIDRIRSGTIRFPSTEFMLHVPNDKIAFINDFTSIFVEYDENYGTMSYDHTMPDDAFQATMLCYLAAEQYYGRLSRTALPQI